MVRNHDVKWTTEKILVYNLKDEAKADDCLLQPQLSMYIDSTFFF